MSSSDLKPSSNKPVVYNVREWIDENRAQLLPPVCNKMMHQKGQMKAFFVGGPNQRNDYHIEEGEELFYMLEGDMTLKVIEQGEFVDIPIREGEIFLLPPRIAHSPQREANTVGLVIERERLKEPTIELDGLRYHVQKDGKPVLESLYEAWFYCTDLGKELAPVIKSYFASEQHRTGRPIADSIPENPPIKLDFLTKLKRPFPLKDWIDHHRHEIEAAGRAVIFGPNTQFQVEIHGPGSSNVHNDNAEIWLWQIEGEAEVTVDGHESYKLVLNDSILIPVGQLVNSTRQLSGITLIAYQDPTRKADNRLA